MSTIIKFYNKNRRTKSINNAFASVLKPIMWPIYETTVKPFRVLFQIMKIEIKLYDIKIDIYIYIYEFQLYVAYSHRSKA